MAAEKFTLVKPPGSPGFRALGWVSYDEATAQAIAVYEKQIREATAALEAIRDGRAAVRHQTGVYRVHNIRTLDPPATA